MTGPPPLLFPPFPCKVLPMPAESVFFYIFSTLALVGAAAVVLIPNTALAAVFLVLTLVSSAVLFAILDSHFMAIVQVLVYAGAIVVLFLFTVVFLNVKKSGLDFGPSHAAKKLTFLVPIAAAAGYFGWKLAPFAAPPVAGSGLDGGAAGVARLLLTEYVLAFEVTSILIVAAIIGTVAISRGRGG